VIAQAQMDQHGAIVGKITYQGFCDGKPTAPPAAESDVPAKIIIECPTGLFDIAGN